MNLPPAACRAGICPAGHRLRRNDPCERNVWPMCAERQDLRSLHREGPDFLNDGVAIEEILVAAPRRVGLVAMCMYRDADVGDDIEDIRPEPVLALAPADIAQPMTSLSRSPIPMLSGRYCWSLL
ncbi:MAG: hypothetical protein LBR22_03630 [Desulfovibrio sp.]|jgi:hypothetical protein|nr:hypothetical protein [Desulfovibrio sp.]